jgi:hypothetical protein
MATIITVKMYIAIPYSSVRAFTAALREIPKHGKEMETIFTKEKKN